MTAVAAGPRETELEAVFGPGPEGLSPEWRASASSRRFVRSHLGLAIHREGATGLAMSAAEALDAFGWEVLAGLAYRPSVAIVRFGSGLAAVQPARRRALGWSVDELASRAGVDPADAREAERGRKRMPMAVLVPLAEAMGLCPVRFGAVPCLSDGAGGWIAPALQDARSPAAPREPQLEGHGGRS